MTLPSLAYAGIPYQVVDEMPGALALMTAWSRSARMRSGSVISAIFASSSLSPSALPPREPRRAGALSSLARSFIALRSSSVKPSYVLFFAVVFLADFCVSFITGFLATSLDRDDTHARDPPRRQASPKLTGRYQGETNHDPLPNERRDPPAAVLAPTAPVMASTIAMLPSTHSWISLSPRSWTSHRHGPAPDRAMLQACHGPGPPTGTPRGAAFTVFRGRHVPDPCDFTDDELTGYWADVRTAAKAIEQAYQPCQLNYATFDNAVPHVHTHITPRYLDDPAPGRPLPDWVFHNAPTLTPRQLADQVEQLRHQIPASQA